MHRLFASLIAFALSLAVLPAAAVEVTHAMGKTQVPDDPQRIVVLELSFVDALAAVSVAPVGIADDSDRDRVVAAYTDIIGQDWVSVGSRKTPSLERIAALAPDLIIADKTRHVGVYDTLSSIAPTIVLDSLTGDYHEALAQAAVIGKAIGKPEKMARRIATHKARMHAYAEMFRLKSKGVTAQFGVANTTGLWLHSPSSYVASLLRLFGFDASMTGANTGDYAATYVSISLEQLSAIDPDVLILGRYTNPAITDTWTDETLFQELAAVRADHVFAADAHEWSRLRGILAAERLAGRLTEMMTVQW